MVHRSSIPQRRLSIAAMVVAILVCGGLWVVLRSPSSDISESQDASDTPADSAQDEIPATSLVTQDTGTPAPQQAPVNTSPLLGHDVDYKLLISTSSRPALLDLNTGEVQYSGGLPVRPVAVSGNWVVIERFGSGLARLPVDDLGADPVRFLDEQGIRSVNVLPTLGPAVPGQLWVLAIRQTEENQDEIRQSLDLIDLSSGALIDHPLAGEISVTANLLGATFADPNGGLITSPSGGVYTTTADGYQQVTDGRLITANETRALIETCDSALICQQDWLDRKTWQPLDLPVPSNLQPVAIMMPGTDWLFTTRLSATGPASLFNTRTDQTIDLQLPESATSIVLPAVSPDGIWLAEPTQDLHTLTLRNLTTDATTSVILNEPIEGPMFFIQQ